MSKATAHAFSDDVSRISTMFSERIRSFGDGPECAEHSDLATQEQRLRILCEIADLRDARILDFGCATGHLLTLLQRDYGYRGEYVGYDISADMIAAARNKHTGALFEVRDVLAEGIGGEFDYIIVSGTFNDRLSDNWAWMRHTLPVLFAAARHGLAFNNLSRYVDYFDEHLFYVDPADVLQFCKEQLSPLVSLRHDYCMRAGIVPYEFTTYVHRCDIACRELQPPT